MRFYGAEDSLGESHFRDDIRRFDKTFASFRGPQINFVLPSGFSIRRSMISLAVVSVSTYVRASFRTHSGRRRAICNDQFHRFISNGL